MNEDAEVKLKFKRPPKKSPHLIILFKNNFAWGVINQDAHFSHIHLRSNKSPHKSELHIRLTPADFSYWWMLLVVGLSSGGWRGILSSSGSCGRDVFSSDVSRRKIAALAAQNQQTEVGIAELAKGPRQRAEMDGLPEGIEELLTSLPVSIGAAAAASRSGRRSLIDQRGVGKPQAFCRMGMDLHTVI